jgi:hypothetical protein
VIGDDSLAAVVSLVVASDPRREGLLFLPDEMSQEARSYDKMDVGDDMI